MGSNPALHLSHGLVGTVKPVDFLGVTPYSLGEMYFGREKSPHRIQ